MKITKKKGFNLKEVSHIKKQDRGILGELKDKNSKDFIEKKFEELKEMRVDYFFKTPKELKKNPTDREKENHDRRKKLQNYFSNFIFKKNSEGIEIIEKIKNNSEKVNIEKVDFKPFVFEEDYEGILNALNENCENLDVFNKYLLKNEIKLNKIKNSLIKNKSQFKIEKAELKVLGKRNKFYEYYSDLKKIEEFEKNVINGFKELYSETDIENLKALLIEEKTTKSEIFNTYREIIKKNIIPLKNEEFENSKKNYSELKLLTKSQLFYKYIIETEVLTEQNIKHGFPHIIQIEMKYLLQALFLQKENKDKVNLIFKDYNSVIELIKNKLKNKLLNYINAKGKIKEYYSKDNEKYIESYDLSKIRVEESIVRNLIGAVSSASFSLRNIINSEEKEDILQKEIKDINDEKFNMFYGELSEEKDKIKEIVKLIKKYTYKLRNNILHFKNQNDKIKNVFNLEMEMTEEDISVLNEVFLQYNEEYLKKIIIKQLNSSNVFKYMEKKDLLEYLKKTKFSLKTVNKGFVPSFYKIYEKINDYKMGLELPFGVLEISSEKSENEKIEEKERRDAQIFLLKQVYYSDFLENFLSNDDNNNFNEIVKEVIELNNKGYATKKTGHSKLEKFNEVSKIRDPIKFLGEMQSLYALNSIVDKESGEENIFIIFIKKIFIKGFCEYVEKNYKTLIEIENNGVKDSEIKSQIDLYYTPLNKKKEESIIKILNAIMTEIKIEDYPLFSTNANKLFYLFLKLLDSKELSNLKGCFEKLNANLNIHLQEENKILNLAILGKEKIVTEIMRFSNLKIIESLIECKLSEIDTKAIKELNEFSKNRKVEELTINDAIYSDGTNLIENNGIYNLKKHGMIKILEGIVDNSNYKITSKDIDGYYALKNQIGDLYKKQAQLHSHYIKKSPNFNKNEYKEIIRKLNEYNLIKNKVEFNDLNLIQSIILRVLHRMAGFVSLWERDLKLKLIAVADKNDPVEEIFNHKNNQNNKYSNGQICVKYKQFLDENFSLINILPKNVLLAPKIYLRNYIAHFNYVPEPKFSIIEILEKMRELMDYDRKLKNAILKAVIDIFKEYGFNIKFKITQDKKICIEEVKSIETIHLKKLGKNNQISIVKYSGKMCEVIKKTLYYKYKN